ncbi:hypothetical protein ACEPAH_8619 [Sanghuangporus vaninii]
MEITRKSTYVIFFRMSVQDELHLLVSGNLPVAKHNYVPDEEFSDKSDPSEKESEMSPSKCTRKSRCTTSNRSGEPFNDILRTPNEGPTIKKGDADNLNSPDNNGKTSMFGEFQAVRSLILAFVVKAIRMNSLIIGPSSKGVLARADATPVASKKKIRVRKSDLGKISRMMELSVEVFCEIASCLTPLDLLRLSRTSRTLRDFFLSRSSRAIWIASIMAIGMPPCPSDMSEPQYANLYFEKECHACDARIETRMDFHHIRLCKGCSDVNFVQGKKLVKENFDLKIGQMYEIYTLLPWKNMRHTDISDRHAKITPGIENHHFLKYDFLEVVKAYLETRPNSNERKTFVERRHQLIRETVPVKELFLNLKKIKNWQRKRSFDRQESEYQACSRRQAQIREKLCSLGYSNDDIDSLSLAGGGIGDEWCRIVYQPRELTDRIWKSIRPKLEELFHKKKQLNFDRENASSLVWTT